MNNKGKSFGITAILLAGILKLFAIKIAKILTAPKSSHGGYLGELDRENNIENAIGVIYIIAFLLFIAGVILLIRHFVGKNKN